MSLAAHVSTLETRHTKLEVMLEEESRRPMPDFAVIQTLKKQKLLLKEELTRIESGSHWKDDAA